MLLFEQSHPTETNMTEDNPFQSPKAHLADAEPVYSEIRTFGFDGRMGRLRTLTYTVISGIIASLGLAMVVGILAAIFIPNLPKGDGIVIEMTIFALMYLALIAGTLAVPGQYGVRRLHDLNLSGWWWLLMLLPLLNLFFYLYLLVASGTPGTNKYGPPPPPNTAGVWVGVLVPVLVVPLIGFIVIAGINESNEFRRRSYSKVGNAEFSGLLKSLRANSVSLEETRSFLASLHSKEAPPYTALQIKVTGDSVQVQFKNPKQWAQIQFLLSAQENQGEVTWKCTLAGESSKAQDAEFGKLRQRCQEFQ
ncbi:MAG: Inner membrane protein YhaH [Betaproteobacteria bacterium ADurb.Bin341]|nr:MAG: Inner membrane protein YhaH [Betaproteobacteria bacterium ADurb.Bin341]